MSQSTSADTLRIDIDAVLRQRLPRHYRFIPRGLVSWLKRVVCQEQMNRLLDETRGLEGADFSRAALKHLDVECTLVGEDRMPAPEDRRVIYICNHPLGGLDGMALIDMITRRHGVEPGFLVNDLLMAVKPLRRVFLPINKHGRQNRGEVEAIEEAMQSDRPIIIFPAGLVSRRHPDGSIADLEWKKKFIDYAIRYRRDVMPLYFDGVNSRFFYKFARLRTRLGIKFNIEMILLPREVFRACHSRFKVHAGHRIPWTSLSGGSRAKEEAAGLRSLIYDIKNDNTL